MPVCEVCHHHCNLAEGQTGLCHARICKDSEIRCENYGYVTSLALDPIEKKPLARFHPGSFILSAGSYGCNLRCPFCQNYSISYGFGPEGISVRKLTPEELVDMALECRMEDGKEQPSRNLGIAFTYNEPLVGYEFVRDTAKLAHEKGLLNVLVSNGNVSEKVCEEILPYIDAMNIDLKGFTDSYYSDVLKGDRKMVMDFIEKAAKSCHVEVTTLIVPGYNDTPEEISELSAWLAGLDCSGCGSACMPGTDSEDMPDGKRGAIPLHISRYFPRFRMTDVPATDVGLIYELAEVAREHLMHVYTGNC